MQLNWFEHLDSLVDDVALVKWIMERKDARILSTLRFEGHAQIFAIEPFRLQLETLGIELLDVQATKLDGKLVVDCYTAHKL